MSDFEIKRGMVFFLDVTKIQQNPCASLPTKNRPYVVLSNDLCNQSSTMIHVAPIFTKSYEDSIKKWYLIPFKESDYRESAINISSIMLIPKMYCTSTNYSKSLTSLVRFNKNLFELIDSAICRQFAVNTDVIRPEVKETIQQYPVYNQPIPVIQNIPTVPNITLPNITLNISVNGIPVSTDAVSVESTVADMNDTISDAESIDNSTKETEQQIVLGVEKQEENTASTKPEKKDYSDIKVNKFKRHGRSFSTKQINILKKFIIDNHRDFNGDMTYYRIGKIFGISLTAVQKYAEEAKADFDKSDNGKNVKHTGKQSMLPKELYSEFLDFYVNHTMEETLEKYAKYGYTKASQIKDKLYSIRKELNTYKVKRRNGSVTTVKKNK